MKCRIKLDIIKILTLEFELSAGKKDEEKVDEQKKEPPAPTTPSK